MSARVFDSVMKFHGKAILSPFVDGVLERAKTDGGRGGGVGGSMPSAGLAILLGSHPTDLTLWTHGPSDLAPFYVILAVSKVW